MGFINDHRETYGVESICRVVPIAPSTYYRHRARQLDPTKRSARAVRDERVKAIIQRIWREHDQAYGSRKVLKQMGREGLREARCRVRRLMRELGLVGVVRGRPVDHDDAARYGGGAPGRSRRSPLRRDATQSTLGQRYQCAAASGVGDERRKERLASRTRLAGAGCKPPQAAWAKSPGRERCGKGASRHQVRTNAGEHP